MHQIPQRDAQPPDDRDYLSHRPVSFLLLKVVGVLGITFCTTVMLVAALEPQSTRQPATTLETANEQPIVQPSAFANPKLAQNQDNQKLKKQERVVLSLPFSSLTKKARKLGECSINESLSQSPGLSCGDSLPASVASLLPSLRRSVAPALASSQPQHQKSQPPQNQLLTLGDLRSHTTLHPVKEQPTQKTPSSSVALGLQTSFEFALKLSQALQNHRTHAVTKVNSQAQLSQGQPTEPVVETIPKPNQPESTLKAQEVKLTLSDIVILALENNRTLKNAYLERIVQKQDLAVAEDKFEPKFTPTVSVSLAQFGSDGVTSNGDLGLQATVKVPTGGELSFRWAVNGQTLNENGFSSDTNDDPFEPNLQLSFNQPLLRGAGINVNRASVEISRLTEQINVLTLKSTLINTITDAIVAYRELLRAQERLKIAQLSLQSAQESLEFNRVLIEAGRLAPVDIVQSETAVANRQVSLLSAENNLEARRLALLKILDIDRDIAIVPTETLTATPVPLNSNKLRQLAFENQPDYLQAQLDRERTKLDLLQAENNRLWDLSLSTSLSNASINKTDVRAGLVLTRDLGDLTVERDFQRSRVNQLKAENTLEEQQESLEIQVTDSIRDVNLSLSEVELARKATESSERQLEIAREKQRLGREVTVFELVRLQDDLAQARNVELNATIDYLNALTRLDQTLGTTLDTWQVTIERK